MNQSANSTGSFEIQSNTTWSVNRPDTSAWLTIMPATGANIGSVFLVATENLTGAHRIAVITVTGIGVGDKTIFIYQAAPPPAGLIDITSINPTRCWEKGTLIITLDGATEGDIYDIDYTNDGMYDAMDTVHNNTLTIMDVPVGTLVTNFTMSDRNNNVQSPYTAPTLVSIQGPSNTVINDVAYIDMINCVKNGTINISLTGANEGDNYNIDLNNDGTIDRTASVNSGTLTIKNITGGQTYTGLSIMNPLTSCGDTSTQAIIVDPLLPQVTGDQSLCPGSQNVSYQVDYNNECNYTWQVTGGTFVAGTQPSEISVNWSDTTGTVQLIRNNTLTGCRDTSLLAVRLFDTIKPKINCLLEYHVEAMYMENELYYIFSNADKSIVPAATDNCFGSLIYSFNYNESDYHELSEFSGFRITNNGQNQMKWTISDRSANAETCATTIIFETNRIVPSAFSPNGDLMNDVWNIKFLKQYPNCIVKVFNRWGIAIYESEKGYPVSWDGRRNGDLVPVDSYYYVISMGDGSASMQGYVTVIY